MSDPLDLPTRVRLAVYEHFVSRQVAPTVADLAAALRITPEVAQSALESLAEAHVLVLHPTTRALWMAAPFSAVPTGFQVRTGRGQWWANCVWDAFGIPALLGEPGKVIAVCAGSGAPLELELPRDGVAGEAVAHFAVPARHWWDDIGFT